MKKSSEFSRHTQERLNNTPFDELDAAETRLSGWDFHLAYLKSRMTTDELAALAWVEQHAGNMQEVIA